MTNAGVLSREQKTLQAQKSHSNSSSILHFTMEAAMIHNLAKWGGLAVEVFCIISVFDLLYFTSAD